MTERIARAASRRPWRTIGAWLLAIVLAGAAIATLLPNHLTTNGGAAGDREFRRANREIASAFPPDPRRDVSDIAVVRSSRYAVGDPRFRDFVARLVADGKATHLIQGARVYLTTHDPSLVSGDRHATMIPLAIGDGVDVTKLDAVVRRADRDPAFDVALTGQSTISTDFDKLSQQDLKNGELKFGLPAALVVLVIVFGALVAGLVPLVLAILSIVVALGLVGVVAQGWELSVFVVNMLTGMGLALGIDYSLFVISRYREERGRGLAEPAAIAVAGATASRAVLFSGTAFVVAMFGMLIVPNTIMRSLAVGAILVGAVSVVAALTLLPAVLGLLGDRVNALRLPLVGRASVGRGGAESRFWRRIVDAVLRRPALPLVAATALLLAAASPVLGLKIGTSGVSSLPSRFVSKHGFEALRRDFPRATTDPARIVTDKASTPAVQAALARVRSTIASDPRFDGSTTERSSIEDVAVIVAPFRADPLAPRSIDAVRNLREHVVPHAFAGTGANVHVGGTTSENVDYLDSVTSPAPYVFLFVLGLTFILLTIVFRSLVIAAKALVLNLLSVGAAYGLVVLVFEHGIGAGLFGFHKFPVVEAWVPLFLFSVLFGLSMDYQVFLLSRIKERFDEAGDTSAAVSWGVASTARIITGAALIIVAVFLGFAMGDLVMFQEMGFGVAVALLLDATLIRSVVLPSAMKLLGRWNWYLPSWLEWLPRLEVEGRS